MVALGLVTIVGCLPCGVIVVWPETTFPPVGLAAVGLEEVVP